LNLNQWIKYPNFKDILVNLHYEGSRFIPNFSNPDTRSRMALAKKSKPKIYGCNLVKMDQFWQ
jgi:hypothetical protein